MRGVQSDFSEKVRRIPIKGQWRQEMRYYVACAESMGKGYIHLEVRNLGLIERCLLETWC